MKNLISRIKRRIEMTTKTFREDLRFSIYLAVIRMLDDLSWRLQLRGISNYFHNRKDKWILRYLENQLDSVIEKYQNDDYIGEFAENAPVWVCWWSGEESAPKLVKQCIKSIRKNAGTHPVIMVTENTYSQYIQIPHYILDNVKNGNIGIAHLSDYIRICLIEKYGGLWLDATIYCLQQIPTSYFEYEIFTCKSIESFSRYISNYRWTTFCLAGWKHNVFYRFLKEAIEQYWIENKWAIDYLFFDYIIQIAYLFLPTVKKSIDAIPLNNLHRDDLQAAMNAALPKNEFENIINSDTVLYKLSWREKYSEKTVNGEKSIYAFFLEIDI